MEPMPYDRRSRILHWVSTALILALIPAGFLGGDMEGGARLWGLRAHVLGGDLVAALTLWRVVRAARGRLPEALPDKALQLRLRGAVHGLLYVVALAMAATGTATVLTGGLLPFLSGQPVPFPDLREVPALDVHETIAFVLMALVALHVAGVLLYQRTHGRALQRMGLGRS